MKDPFLRGTVISVDPTHKRCAVRCRNGKELNRVGYIYPYLYRTGLTKDIKFGIKYIPPLGSDVLVINFNGEYYIAGFFLPPFEQFDTPLSPGDFILASSPNAYILFEASGRITAAVSPLCYFEMFPQENRMNFVTQKYSLNTDLGLVEFGTDITGNYFKLEFEEQELTSMGATIPQGSVFSFSIKTITRTNFEMKLDRLGIFTLALDSMQFEIDKLTQSIKIKAPNIIVDSQNIQLGGLTAVIPAVRGTELINVLTQIIAALNAAAGGLTNPNASSAVTAAANAAASMLSSILSTKVKLE